MRQHSCLVIRHGVLYRHVTHQNRELLQLVVPLSQQPVVLRAAHDAMGHPGVERMMLLLHVRVFFPDMQLRAQHYVRVCEACKLFSAKAEAADVERYTASAPFELLHMDFLKLDPCKGGIENVLVVVDHFTRFAWAIPTRNQTAAVTAEVLWHNVFSLFGWPECILSDQGANFLSQLMTEFCQLAGTEKLRTSIYHPQCNGAAEWFNHSLLKLLGTMPQNHKHDWKNYIHAMTHAHNSLRCTATGFSPFYLMFGREPWVPLDAFLPSLACPIEVHRSYVRRFQERMNWVFEQARQHQNREIERMKPYMSRQATASRLAVGDHVLVRVLKFDSRHKLANRWESEPYVVVSQLEGLPVFRIRLAADCTASHRTLHRNHLLKLTTNLFNLPKEKRNRNHNRSACRGAFHEELGRDVCGGVHGTRHNSVQGRGDLDDTLALFTCRTE